MRLREPTREGQARFGPDVSWIDGVDYGFEDGREAQFYTAIRGYFPALADGALTPGQTGIRPKLAGASAAAQDVVIQSESEHGVPGLVNLYGVTGIDGGGGGGVWGEQRLLDQVVLLEPVGFP